jgi:predicted dehydrogenase
LAGIRGLWQILPKGTQINSDLIREIFMSANSKGKIRTGIVGIGNWGRYGHIPVLQLLPDFQIVAVSSRRQEYAAEIAKNFGVPHAFTNAQELIIHPEVDLVIVLPPAPQHGALVRDAIAAGKDVYCEWPLTTNREDTEDLLARAEGAGVRHIVGLQRRLGPSARYVRDLLAAGYVGKMRSVRLHVSMNYFQGQRSTDLRWRRGFHDSDRRRQTE